MKIYPGLYISSKEATELFGICSGYLLLHKKTAVKFSDLEQWQH